MRKRTWIVAVLAIAALVALALSSSSVGAPPVHGNKPPGKSGVGNANQPAGKGSAKKSANKGGADSANNPKAKIQQGNHFCGADRPDLPVIGFSNYHRSGNTVSVNFHLKKAMPKASYRIDLWGDACSFFGVVGTVTTNSHGVANVSGSVTVPAASTRFFATAAGPNGFNDTPAVTLTP
jgi:hypothetical protein